MTSQSVNQEVIDAYYEYTHLTLDRSKFANKLREMAKAEVQPRPFLVEGEWTGLHVEVENKFPQ
ncbi:hypothetical protein SAMN05421890_1855 [Ensifer adhaerens]|nr:hypothetical protein SAMN05421890_1855 [Ensifer adhaerens]HZG27325.1 hypothetical protein [Ensifer sp.]